jgi:DNA-binding CsgD family transcriptional regulator
MNDKTQLLKEYSLVLKPGDCKLSDKDYCEFEVKKSLLLQLSQVENSSMTVYDMHRGEYVFVQSKFDTQVCYPLNEFFKKEPRYFFELMPYPDLKFTVDTLKRTFAFLKAIDNSKKKEYKLIFEFRLSDPAGNLFRFIQQCLVLEQDDVGNIWMVLILNDLIPNKLENSQLIRRLLHMPTGEICLFQDDSKTTSIKFLSKRETEILGLLSQGLQSKEISDKLFISLNTVNNHRQKIIEKLNVENTHEALRYAKTIGII